MKHFFVIVLIALACFANRSFAQVAYVDMFMGQKGNSQCTIGPQMPHGSVCPGPDTPNGGHDGYAENQLIRGFSQLHVSGTGWGRYGQILLSPQTGTFSAEETGHDSEKDYELATPYYYKVRLARYDVLTEITPTNNTVSYRFTYPEKYVEDGKANLLLDICHNIPEHIYPDIKGRYLGGEIHYDGGSMLTGYGEYMGGFGSTEPYRVYFAIASDNIDLSKAEIKEVPYDNGKVTSRVYARIPINKTSVDIRVGISMRSIENAQHFIREECPHGSDFGNLEEHCKEEWDRTLGKIQIKGATETEKKLFYTCLYFSNVMPRKRTDDNPRWLGTNYDDQFCIWDTWRTKFPLMNILDESFVSDVINSFLNRWENEGKCDPTFTGSLNWADRQGGDDCLNVIADAMVKGVEGFDYKRAYKYVKANSQTRRSPEYLKFGWQPEVGGLMSCSNALEYAYNDYCAYEIASKMGDKKFAKKMLKRSASWQKLFNPEQKDDDSAIYGFITPRKKDGSFIETSPRKFFGSWVEYFYEGNSWTYSLFAPHDFPKLVELCGGKEKMAQRLSYGFDHGLIYLWNEPGFLTPFIFHHCDRPDLSAKYVSMLRKNNYGLDRGFCDNEDSGAMGSWYVFTSLGFFPNAGQDLYYVLPPAYPRATVKLTNGKRLHIVKEISSYPYSKVKAIYLNGELLQGFTLTHSQIMNGGELRIVVE